MNKHATSRQSRSRGAADRASARRRDAIVDLVRGREVASQSDLAGLLARRGFEVTQATLSRDLRSLGIGKRPGAGGAFYVLPDDSREIVDARRREIEIESFVIEVRVVQNLVLVRTPPGNANGVGRAIDLYGWPEVAGTVAGDDTVLVVTATRSAAQRLRKRLGGEGAPA